MRPIVSVAARLSPAWVVLSAACAIFLFGLLGSRDALRHDLLLFSLQQELNVPAFFSALLWVGAGLAALCAATATDGRTALAWRVLGVVLVYLGFDELFMLHERLEKLVGFSYQRLYAPLMLTAGLAGLRILWESRRDPVVVALLVVGGACAASAQLIDLLQWDNDRLVWPYWTIVPEELLEMTGLVLVGLSGLFRLQRETGPVAPPSWAAGFVARLPSPSRR